MSGNVTHIFSPLATGARSRAHIDGGEAGPAASRGTAVTRPGDAPAGSAERHGRAVLDREAPMDEIRVRAVRNALASGRYDMDVFRIADRLANFERMLSGAGP